KRLQTDAGVESATRAARRQLEMRHKSPSTARVIALDLSRVVRPSSHLFHAQTVDDLNAVIAADFKHARDRIQSAYRRGAGRVVDLVVLVVAVPTHSTTDNVWRRAEHKYALTLRRRATPVARVAASDMFCEVIGIPRSALPPRWLEPHER